MEAKFSQRVKDVLSYSREEAIRLGNDYIGLEHLLLGIIREGEGMAIQILAYFGVDLAKIRKEIEEVNICYLHAPLFHPAMKNVGPVRKALKVKTFFNILGPMVNPARPQNQLAGVFNEEVQKLYSEVYKKENINHIIVYSLDGYDEISLTYQRYMIG